MTTALITKRLEDWFRRMDYAFASVRCDSSSREPSAVTFPSLQEIVDAAVQEEREACGNACLSVSDTADSADVVRGAERCARLIRDRSP